MAALGLVLHRLHRERHRILGTILVQRFLGLAARFGGFALGLLDAFAAAAAPGFFFGEPEIAPDWLGR